MSDDRILEKIKKCLAMAEDSRGDPTTAATALRQAQKLMEMHNISLGAVHATGVGEHRAKFNSWTRPAKWELDLGHILGDAFGCKFYLMRGRPWLKELGEIVFLGLHGHVESCAYAYDVIHREATRARTKFVQELPSWYERGQKMAEGDTFVFGYLTNVRKQISALVLEEPQRLAIENKKREVLGENAPTYSSSKGARGSVSAYGAGREAGGKLSVHRAAGGPQERLKIKG